MRKACQPRCWQAFIKLVCQPPQTGVDALVQSAKTGAVNVEPANIRASVAAASK